MRLVGDIESDGFLDEMTQVHCIVIHDLDEGIYYRFNDQGIDGARPIQDAISMMNEADELYFHYGHGFDYPALKKFYPEFNPKRGAMFDTCVMAEAVYRDIRSLDFKNMAKGKYPDWFAKEQLVGKHKLRAWGVRLGEMKTSIAGDDGTTDWSRWTPEMEDYCEQDVRVTVALIELLTNEKNIIKHPMECHRLDNEFQHCMSRQERQGILFDQDKATTMLGDVSQKLFDINAKLQEVFKPFYKRGKPFTPKRDNKAQGYVAGVDISKVELTEFNPGSRDHIQNRLQKLYGWEPTEYGKDGKATVDNDVLSLLDYPTVPLLLEYLMLKKRLGQLSDGKKAWLKYVKADGRIHGRVNPLGTVSWRCSHSHPNMGQVPSVVTDDKGVVLWGVEGVYGADSRSLFVVPDGFTLCGHDASGLELRCLAHYMAKFDGGAYVKELLEGDVHTVNQKAIGLNHRRNAKTWIYAMLYGSGDELLGYIILEDMNEAKRARFTAKFGSSGKSYSNALRKLGRKSKTNLENGLPALSKLIDRVKAKAKEDGYLTGLDGRRLKVRSIHSCFNLLLQSAGAIVMKRWLVVLDESLQENGFIPMAWTHPSVLGNYEYVANVHDEGQTEVEDSMADKYDELAVAAFNVAGDYYNYRCPIDGEGKQGKSWFETH
jgi:DNA polymerase I-like protein with 3'-5' exonuclease and polymerase domains